MTERAHLPIAVAATAGFVGGIIGAVLQLAGGSAFTLGAVVALAGAIAGRASVAACEADPDERRVVGWMRAGLGAVAAVCTFVALLAFLRDGQPVLALFLLAAAGAAAFLCTRVVVRGGVPAEQRQGRETTA